jgi:2-polyprenyl-3-methyl-5-hydroxy-6-metoxy-1,4-benzoquinol methylase
MSIEAADRTESRPTLENSAPTAVAERQQCSACGSLVEKRLVKRLARGISVMRCPACDVRAISPMPTPEIIRAHYSQYYLTRTDDDQTTERLVALHAPIAEWLLARMDGTRANRVLDYGFGSGAVLIQMARRGQVACGGDLSTQNVEQLRRYGAHHGLAFNLVDLSTDSIDSLGEESFDLITLFQVIEHLVDPLARLRELAARQAKGGLLYLECPNDPAFISWTKRFTRVTPGRKLLWGSLKYPEHLHGFGRRSMRNMLEACGYSVEVIDDYAYRDGLHQVEAEVWWPRFRDNPNPWSIHGLTRSAIPLADKFLSAAFRSGSGLYALARKVR